MRLKISVGDLRARIEQTHFANQGDGFEQQYWPVFKERFPHLEEFWRWCVVPMTARIEQAPGSVPSISKRDVASDLWQISFRHYSAFCHLTYAYERLRQAHERCAFVEFYSHLGSVCDLAEDFLIDVHLLVLFCRNQSSTLLCELSRAQFLDLAAEWYDQSYSGTYENYLAKGKGVPFNLPSRKSLVREYLGKNSQTWKQYEHYAGPLRAYRNFMVHGVALGEVQLANGIRLVPKKQRLSAYKTLDEVFAAARDVERLKRDFINHEEQMIADFGELQAVLNIVWEKPIEDLTKLLYEERNKKISEKYNLDLADE
jgi:hypothetical protein